MALASEIPTVDEFITRFPQFEDADEDMLNMVIKEASGSVGDDWIVADQKPAIMYLTAHLVTMEASVASGGTGTAGRGTVVAESFGPMSTTYANPNAGGGSGSSASLYGQTEYGRRYWEIAKRNTPDVVVVGGEGVSCNPWCGWFG